MQRCTRPDLPPTKIKDAAQVCHQLKFRNCFFLFLFLNTVQIIPCNCHHKLTEDIGTQIYALTSFVWIFPRILYDVIKMLIGNWLVASPHWPHIGTDQYANLPVWIFEKSRLKYNIYSHNSYKYCV